jgi:ABC-type polar amino acid transport system ATPase subunit
LFEALLGHRATRGAISRVARPFKEGAKADLNALRRSMGMVFQSFNLYPHMTALGNVTLALRKVLRKPRTEAGEIAQRALSEVGLADKAASYPSELSGGQQQRVAIASALALGPKIRSCSSTSSPPRLIPSSSAPCWRSCATSRRT